MNLRARLVAIEERAGNPAAGCPECAAAWPGGVFIEQHADGRRVPRCWRCGTSREQPTTGPVKVLAAGLWELI